MTVAQKTNCAKIARHYGQHAQLAILQEECAELIQAASKIRRSAPKAHENFIDELADVSIMIEQMLSFMDNYEVTEFFARVDEKINRQIKRIEQGI